jgi:hypothetical protein
MRQVKFLFFIVLLIISNVAIYAQNLNLVGSYAAPGGAQTVSIQGNYAYIGGTVYIDIVNITDPTHPIHSGRVNKSGIDRIRAIGNYLYVSSNDSFIIYDIGNQLYPLLISSHPMYYAGDFFLYLNYVYVQEFGEMYQILDITDPANPNLMGYIGSIGWGDGYIAYDTLAFFGEWDGLSVWSLSNPIQPSQVGFLSIISGNLHSIFVEDNMAFASSMNGSLYIIDVSNPSSPSMISAYTTAGRPWSETISGNYVFLAEEEYGIEVVNKSDPANPIFATSYDTPGFTYELAIVGDYVYVADNTSLQILRFDPTGIDDGNEGVPTKFSLYQNYPNPFNASTTFNYYISKSTDAKLTIYNLQGQEVATVLDGLQSAGPHNLI